MFGLTYSSVAATELNAQELDQLLGESRLRNQADDLTGLLLHISAPDPGSAFFVQRLEGPQAAVESLYHRIEKDELHGGLVVLDSGPIGGRQFAGWSMRLAELTPAELERFAGPGPVAELVRDPDAVQGLIHRYTA